MKHNNKINLHTKCRKFLWFKFLAPFDWGDFVIIEKYLCYVNMCNIKYGKSLFVDGNFVDIFLAFCQNLFILNFMYCYSISWFRYQISIGTYCHKLCITLTVKIHTLQIYVSIHFQWFLLAFLLDSPFISTNQLFHNN